MQLEPIEKILATMHFFSKDMLQLRQVHSMWPDVVHLLVLIYYLSDNLKMDNTFDNSFF